MVHTYKSFNKDNYLTLSNDLNYGENNELKDTLEGVSKLLDSYYKAILNSAS